MLAVCLANSGGIMTCFPTNGKLCWPLFAITHGAKKSTEQTKKPSMQGIPNRYTNERWRMWSSWKWIRHRMNRVSRSPQTLSQRSHSQFLFHLQNYYIYRVYAWLAVSDGSSRLALYTCKQHRLRARPIRTFRFQFTIYERKKHVFFVLLLGEGWADRYTCSLSGEFRCHCRTGVGAWTESLILLLK